MTVDYEKNSFADTGLFVKVVPEEQKLDPVISPLISPMAVMDSLFKSSTVEMNSPFNSSAVEMDGPCNSSATSDPAPFTTGYHRQWMENINKKLAALRIRVNAQQTRSYSRSKNHNTWLSQTIV